MDEQRLQVTANAAAAIRSETMMGRRYRVIPAVILQSQVLDNNLGTTFVPADEIAASEDAWNGMPVIIRHPTSRGQKVSARTPRVLDERGAGFVFGAKVDGDKLRAEVWVDMGRATDIEDAGDVMNRVDRGEVVELSTGFRTRIERTEGVHNGRTYGAVLRDIRPDHLALLPTEQGACSVMDGCGLGVNHAGECDVENMDEEQAKTWWAQFVAAMRRIGVMPDDHSQQEDTMGREQMIAHLVEAGTDEEALAALSDCQVKALYAAANDGGEPKPEGNGDAQNENDEPSGESKDAADKLIAELQAKVERLENTVAPVAEETERERTALIAELAKNDRVPFEEAELKDRPLAELRKIRSMAKGETYVGRGGPQGGDVEATNDFMPVRPYWDTGESKEA